jgi:hypothetical protein
MLDNLPATSTPARTLGEFACGLTFEQVVCGKFCKSR